MKRIDTVSVRIFSLLLLGIIGSAALTWWLAFGERQNTLSHERNSFRAERARNTEQLILAIEALPASNRDNLLKAMPRLGLSVSSFPSVIPDYQATSAYAVILSERLSKNFKLFALPAAPEHCLWRSEERPNNESCEALLIVLKDGSTLKQSLAPNRALTPPIPRETYYYLALFLACIAALAILVSRITIRPLQRLAKAAKNLGQDINRPALKEAGPKEIQQAIAAFNSMQTRIREHIQERTQMLAAITHDLQTPLTRLRLRLEKVNEEELRQKLVEDLSSMQAMVKEGLDLARSMDSNEAMQTLDLLSLINSLCDDARDAGHQVQLRTPAKATVMARPQSLKRCLNNLIDNGIKYGNSVEIDMQTQTEHGQDLLKISLIDHGPGIPEDELSRVLEPFYRLETSRSRETGGTGLGLTIAQNIARQHNATLTLRNRPEGGLEVILSLPITSV